MAQPQIRRNTWDGPPGGRSVVDARATELLHVYIYDYCKKHNFHQAARFFAAEANISTDQQPPIDIATGFLADWWGVFWDVYHAKNKDAQATKEAGIHDEYHELLRNRKEEVLQQQRNFSMQQAVQQQQQRRASEVQRLAQSPQLQHPLHGQQQDPQQQQSQQSQQQQSQQQQQQPHVPSQQQQAQQQQQQGQSRDHRPSPASSTASLPNSGGVPPQNNNNVNNNNNNNSNANPGNTNTSSMVNTPQTLSASLPQQHPGHRLGAPSPSFSPQQMQRPGVGNPTGNEGVPGHPEGMMNSPMVSAQPIPMNAQGQMMMNQRPNVVAPNAILQNTMNAMGFGGRDPHSLTPEERAAVQMQVRKQTMYMNQPGMMRNPNMMVNSQAQSRLQQQLMMNHQMYQQQQQQQQMQQGQPQHQMQQGQPQAPQQTGQPQTHQPGQPSIPSQQGAGPQPNPQGPQTHPQGGAQPQQQPQPGQQGQPGPHPVANSQTGNGARPPGAMVPGSGAPTSSGPGQMAGNMQNPNMMPGQFGGGEAMNMMLAQQMMKNGQMAGMTPQQQQQHQQQQQQFLAQQQHQRMLFSQRRMQQQHQQMANQSGQTPPNPNMGSPNPPAPMNAGSPQDDKGRTPLALYQRRQMHYIMQQQHQDQQRQQYVQQQHGQTPPQQQPQQLGHPTKRQRPNPDVDNPNGGGANQSPQMGMASPQVMNAAQTPQNTNNIPGSSQASPVMSMQQRLSQQQQQQQQHQQSSFNQDPNAKPSQSPQMNRNMNKPNQTPQQVPQQLPIQGTPNSSQQGMPGRMGWNPQTQGGEMQSPGMIEGDQSPAATPGGGIMNNGPVPSGNSNNIMSFDLERFMMSDGGDFGEIFTAGDDSGEQNLLMGGDNNEMFGGGFLASMGGGFGGDANSTMGGMDNATSLQLYSELTGHENKVSTVAFSLDGQWLASAGHDKKVLIWSVHDKLLRWTLLGHTSHITCARWSPDQRNLLVTSSYDKSLRVWDLGQAMKDGGDVKEIAKFDCKAQITAVDFAPDRPDTICSLDAEGELNVWHIPSSKSEKTIKMAASKSLFAANPLRFHPRLGKILACAAGNQLFVIDIDVAKNNASSADTAAIRTINADHSKNICSLDWSADGTYLVASSENAVMVYETGQWKLVNRHTATDKISACAFVMPTNNNGTTAGDSSTGGVTGPEKLRVVYGSYESIYVWQCSVSGSQPKRAGTQSGMVAGLACTNNTNGQTIVASASHYKEKNLMLWTL